MKVKEIKPTWQNVVLMMSGYEGQQLLLPKTFFIRVDLACTKFLHIRKYAASTPIDIHLFKHDISKISGIT